MSAHAERLRSVARQAGQEHLFEDWDHISETDRARFLAELERVDFELMAAQTRLLGQSAHTGNLASDEIQAPECFPLVRTPDQERQAQEARSRGAKALAGSKIGFLVVAGGQASRLGFEAPKGTFPIGPLSGWSLFEIHARRLLAAGRRHGFAPVWYVMTSPGNDRATRDFFAAHAHFGLAKDDVRFFSQAMIPAVDEAGKILRAGPSKLFLAPDGHGGSLEAFARSGALADARARGLECLSYFQVDNPLARPADPLFLGLHQLAGARMSSKVVSKRDAHEKVGILARVQGKMGCIEYSDLPASLRESRHGDGSLRFGAGNIAVHAIDVDFAAELTAGGLQLPWHLARKKMPAYEQGRMCEKEGVKFETFVFDALARSPRSVVLEVERRLEFSPVKNKTGDDSPASTRRDMQLMFASWAKAAGKAPPPTDPQGLPAIEVDPLYAEDLYEFRAMAKDPAHIGGGHWYRCN